MENQKKQSGSYLSFKLGNELFAVNVNDVLNILEMTKITAIPNAPRYLRGVINLRGMVLPVVDARLKFNMEEMEYTHNTCIVVMDLDSGKELIHVGFIVDQVMEVLELSDKQIEPPPNLGANYTSEFITGMAKADEAFVMLLDMSKIFSISEIGLLRSENSEVESEPDSNQ